MAIANPYAAPAALVEDVPANPEAEAIRRAHINHEASIKAVGFLYYLGGVGVTLAALFGLMGARADVEGAASAIVLLVIGIGQFFAGWGVRALTKWGRALGCALSALGLLAFKGRTIFAPEYQAVIAATPHVKYRTSIIVWIFLALIAGLILVAIVVPFFGR